MKSNIHPTYYPNAAFNCACGASWTAGSTQKEIRTEICSSCHPFYTGKQNLVDTLGRVDKFRKRQDLAKATPVAKLKTVRKEAGVSRTQIKAALKGSKAIKAKQVVGNYDKKDSKSKKDSKKKA